MHLVSGALAALGLLLSGVEAGGNVWHAETTVTDTKYVDVVAYRTHTNVVTTCLTEYTTTTLHYTVSVTNTATDSTTITTTDTECVTVTNTDTAYVTVTNTIPATVTTTDTVPVTVTTTDTVPVTVTTTDTVPVTVTTTDTVPVTVTTTDTVPATVTTTGTVGTTVTTTGTVPTTVTTTGTVPTTVTTTDTVPATITTFTTETQTRFSITYNPCPTTCSVSADTVSVFYWPTDRPYTYPSTYINKELDYTFTSPSVYLRIPTAAGTNPAGVTVGPVTTNWILPLDLYEVSTIVPGTNATRQLTLGDLGTDCPKTVDPTAIATLDGHCNPVLAAPTKVRQWAYDCNACGRFGLFDPPYAVPTITGSLVVPTTTIPPPPPITVTVPTATATVIPAPPPAPPAGTGLIFVVYCDSDGKPFGTATVTAPGASGTTTSSVTIPATCAATTTAPPFSSTAVSSQLGASSTSPTTAAGIRYEPAGGLLSWFASSIIALLMWI